MVAFWPPPLSLLLNFALELQSEKYLVVLMFGSVVDCELVWDTRAMDNFAANKW